MKVAVICCTLNGAKYIAQQLDSLLGQTHPWFDLLLSDDGSTDDTLKIVDDYKSMFGTRLIIVSHKRSGFHANFLDTLFGYIETYDLFLFCDQDDLWAPNKIERFVSICSKYPSDTDLLIYSNYSIFPADIPVDLVSNFPNLIERSYIPGNVMGISNSLAKDVVTTMDLDRILAHDWFCLVVAVAKKSRIIKVDDILIKYRQHSQNTIGVGFKPRRIYRFLSLLLSGKYRKQILLNLEIFYKFRNEKSYSESLRWLNVDKIQLLDKFFNVLINKKISRGSFIQDFFLVLFMK